MLINNFALEVWIRIIFFTFSMAGFSRLVLLSADEGQKLAPQDFRVSAVIVLF